MTYSVVKIFFSISLCFTFEEYCVDFEERISIMKSSILKYVIMKNRIPGDVLSVVTALPTSDAFNIAPCLAHPCDAPGKNPCKSTCAFARTNVAADIASNDSPEGIQLATIIPAKEYGCSMGGEIKIAKDGSLFMQVGKKVYPSQLPFHPEVVAAQGRLSHYLVGNK